MEVSVENAAAQIAALNTADDLDLIDLVHDPFFNGLSGIGTTDEAGTAFIVKTVKSETLLADGDGVMELNAWENADFLPLRAHGKKSSHPGRSLCVQSEDTLVDDSGDSTEVTSVSRAGPALATGAMAGTACSEEPPGEDFSPRHHFGTIGTQMK